jgi:hypothetical protein
MVLAALLVQGCPLEHSCTEIGCGDGAHISVRTAAGTWSAGDYAIAIATPRASYACRLRLPDDLPDGAGGVTDLSCTPELGLHANLIAKVTCTETRTPDAVSESCTPVPDHWLLDLNLDGTPASFQMQIKRDGATLFDEKRSLRYEASRPNGPDCEPECHQTSVELTLP